MKREWNGDGTGMQRELNGNGTGMERGWNGDTKRDAISSTFEGPMSCHLRNRKPRHSRHRRPNDRDTDAIVKNDMRRRSAQQSKFKLETRNQ